MQLPRTHPLVLVASVALILFCGLGAAALLGALPRADSRTQESQPLVQASAPRAAPSNEPEAAAPSPRPARAETPARTAAATAVCRACGRVDSVRAVEIKGEASGVGAVAGGVLGAVVGNQFGRGGGRTVMTVAGGAGGAIAGHEIEKRVKSKTVYELRLRMEDGSLRTVRSSTRFAVGERVRLNGSAVERA